MNIFTKDHSIYYPLDKAIGVIVSHDSTAQDYKTWKDRKNLLSWYVRMAIVLALQSLVQNQKYPDFWGSESMKLFKKAEVNKIVNDLVDIYLCLAILEARNQGKLIP